MKESVLKRLIDYDLKQWKKDSRPKPILLRGARQVGKTYAVRILGKSFDDYIEINFELNPHMKDYFEKDLDPQRILRDLSLELNRPITPGKVLLFFDEIQSAPQVILALRYFYEMIPQIHIIAAGSLLDFTLKNIGVPVGRVTFLHMYPMTFIEFLYAIGHEGLIREIFRSQEPFSAPLHQKLLGLLGQYIALGGMPEIVQRWKETKDPLGCFTIQHDLINAYKQDFKKYSKKYQEKYVDIIFENVPRFLTQRFIYSAIEGDYRKRELAPALDLLATAGVIHKVVHSAGQGIPLGAHLLATSFKVIFLDVALAQAVLKQNMGTWFLHPLESLINKGEIVESFVGQELLGYSNPHMDSELYYWVRQARNSQAEVDYLVQEDESIIPIEVKSGTEKRLVSMMMFLESHPRSPFGIRFSALNYEKDGRIHTYPLYAIATALKNFKHVAERMELDR
jgi:predicted AAA+ superfamily ATPase